MSVFMPGVNLKRRLYQRFYFPRLLPVLAVLRLHPARRVIAADVDRWREIQHLPGDRCQAMVYLLTFSPEFRYLVYWRMGWIGTILDVFAPGLRTLHVLMRPAEVGPGLYIQHGEATFVHAHRIGKNAWINQGVTIGYTSDDDCPTIEDNVRVAAGAKVLGNVTLGDNVTVGPNAVVLRSVPAGATVCPPTARILRAPVESGGDPAST